MPKEILGVDFGGVICSRTIIGGTYPPIAHALETLKRLRDERFGDNIFIVSCASQELQSIIYDWLARNNFYQMTRIAFDRINFCLERHQKVDICNSLQVTYFIDDRLENLFYLRQSGMENLYLFQGDSDEVKPYQLILPSVKQMASWQEVSEEFLE